MIIARRTRERLLGALVATTLAFAATTATVLPAEAQAAERITGRWVGMVQQDGFDPYRVRVRIFRNDAGVLQGRLAYPNCSGVWKFRKREYGWTKFTEIIREDPGEVSCVPRLGVKVKRVDARLRIVWTYEGQTATSLARRP